MTGLLQSIFWVRDRAYFSVIFSWKYSDMLCCCWGRVKKWDHWFSDPVPCPDLSGRRGGDAMYSIMMEYYTGVTRALTNTRDISASTATRGISASTATRGISALSASVIMLQWPHQWPPSANKLSKWIRSHDSEMWYVITSDHFLRVILSEIRHSAAGAGCNCFTAGLHSLLHSPWLTLQPWQLPRLAPGIR